MAKCEVIKTTEKVEVPKELKKIVLELDEWEASYLLGLVNSDKNCQGGSISTQLRKYVEPHKIVGGGRSVYHAWYSLKDADLNGTVEYEDINGNVVVCTEVTKEKKTFSDKYKDSVYVGEVVKFLKSNKLFKDICFKYSFNYPFIYSWS